MIVLPLWMSFSIENLLLHLTAHRFSRDIMFEAPSHASFSFASNGAHGRHQFGRLFRVKTHNCEGHFLHGLRDHILPMFSIWYRGKLDRKGDVTVFHCLTFFTIRCRRPHIPLAFDSGNPSHQFGMISLNDGNVPWSPILRRADRRPWSLRCLHPCC